MNSCKEMKMIQQCRERKKKFKRLSNELDSGYVAEEDRSILKLAVMRSIAIEDINIKKLQDKLHDI